MKQQTFRAVVPPSTLTPETPVKVVFRGGPPIVDKFDGQDVIIPADANEARLAGVEDWASMFYAACEVHGIPWAVATHIKDRSIVPGTRDPHNAKKASKRIGILWTPTGQYVDKPELCEPFTVEQLKHFGLNEGLDRTGLAYEGGDAVVTIATTAALRGVGDVHQRLTESHADIDLTPGADLSQVAADTAAGEADVAGPTGRVSQTRRGGVGRFKDDK